jgi:hypothetical protein
MKTILLLLTTLLTAASAHADALRTRIFRIEAPSAAGREYQVLSTRDGRVYFVTPQDRALLAKLATLKAGGTPASLLLDGDRVVDAQPLSGDEAAAYNDDFDQPRVANDALEALGPDSYSETGDGQSAQLPQSLTAARAVGYEPTILGSVADARSLFLTERELNHHSQCYERAEVWTREFQQARGVYSMKVFMFFTSRFRNRYTHNVLFLTRPYKWWFHVAPFVYVGNQEYVLDREFINQAVPMDEWTFQFIGKVEHDNEDVPNPSRGEAACLDAVSYAQYSQDPNPARYCVLRKVPMYYFQPLDVEALDCQGGASQTSCQRTVVSSWRDSELKRAYKDTAK